MSQYLGHFQSSTADQLSSPDLLKSDEKIVQEPTVRSKMSSWPEKLIDFEDLGNSDDDGYTESWNEKKAWTFYSQTENTFKEMSA